MWPWEHLAVGYLLYSVVARTAYRRLPDAAGTILVAFGTQFPDLIDKPGSWVFGVLPSGTSVAHSVFVALPVSILAIGLARWRGTPTLGVAFAVGYLSHLLGDVLYSVLLGGEPAVGAVTWPLGPPPAEANEPVVPIVVRLFSQFADHLASPAGFAYVVLEIVLLSLALALWARDGMPGVNLIHRVRSVVPRGG
ncbi:metal-dependent hydrolase [Halosimplex amylolyticum]|uniref:metal-dependent hydrolase n=1 Tax=Halosimplex amylolyticum TaxID=3396616 RepID=UPI003F57EFC0